MTPSPVIYLRGLPSDMGRFGVILCDPPWSYRDLGHTRRIDRQYSIMRTADIAALPVADIALPDSVLFLWATAPLLPDGLEVMKAWGFKYKSGAVWDKEIFGCGHYFRIQHEHLLIGTKGRPGIAANGARNIPSIIRSCRGKHSVKPAEVYVAIERMYPSLPKIELFARNRREGWHSWGNELPVMPACEAPGTLALLITHD
jgi:N6-adenosine-specific RNA methylase IME4